MKSATTSQSAAIIYGTVCAVTLRAVCTTPSGWCTTVDGIMTTTPAQPPAVVVMLFGIGSHISVCATIPSRKAPSRWDIVRSGGCYLSLGATTSHAHVSLCATWRKWRRLHEIVRCGQHLLCRGLRRSVCAAHTILEAYLGSACCSRSRGGVHSAAYQRSPSPCAVDSLGL
jgi:hypothetical protein